MLKIKFMLTVMLSVLIYTLDARDLRGDKVLGCMVLGTSTVESVSDNVQFSEVSVRFVGPDNDRVDVIKLNDHTYAGRMCNVVLVFVNDRLFFVKYYPLTDRMLARYQKRLDKVCMTCNNVLPNGDVQWRIDDMVIIRGMDERFVDYFIHYDSDMLTKYQQYKNFDYDKE